MIKKYLFSIFFLISIAYSSGLYSDNFFQKSGIVDAPISTGVPNRVRASRLINWHHYFVRLSPIVFNGDRVVKSSENTLARLKKLIQRNRSKIYYISIVGHCSSVIDNENEIELDSWSNLWQHLANGEPRLRYKEAVKLVNRRLHKIYGFLRHLGVPSSRIYTENLLDQQLLYTEATREGRLKNNRVEITLYTLEPLE